jgi:hypothetical protein
MELPTDPEVLHFLTGHRFSTEDALSRSHAFLLSLFQTTTTYLKDISGHIEPLVGGVSPDDIRTLQQKFRLLMTGGQSFRKQGEQRQQFYAEVITLAETVCLSHDVNCRS